MAIGSSNSISASPKTPEAARRRPTTHRDVINSLETGSVIWSEYVLFYPQGFHGVSATVHCQTFAFKVFGI
jgi:hypothetical protein